MSTCRFEIPECPAADVQRLQRELGVSGALAQVLVRRGMAEPAAARAFLAGGEEHPPELFAGIGEAVAVILGHVARGTRITIHGDYDVDGICSTAVLVRALRGLAADVDSYLPDRAGDGYGLNATTVRRLAARGTRLLVTVDCAITAVEEVAAARALGMEVVVSDHHAPRADGALPQAPLVHPRLCGYPCPDLCATAVAYKLAQALLAACARGEAGEPCAERAREMLARGALEQDLDLVALATIADVVELVGENRTLVRRGLRALAGTAKPGLRALMSVARVDPAKVDERSVAFALGAAERRRAPVPRQHLAARRMARPPRGTAASSACASLYATAVAHRSGEWVAAQPRVHERRLWQRAVGARRVVVTTTTSMPSALAAATSSTAVMARSTACPTSGGRAAVARRIGRVIPPAVRAHDRPMPSTARRCRRSNARAAAVAPASAPRSTQRLALQPDTRGSRNGAC